MAEEPSLPQLPPLSWDERSQSFSNNPRKRVRNPRQGNSPLPLDSSDPAVFSSDDDPGLDNYVEGRRKKRYVGTWFQQHPTSSDSTFSDGPPRVLPKPKRTLKRQFDSGVYLGSDGTDCDSMLDELEIPVRAKLPPLEKRHPPKISSEEILAQGKIQECLEQGNENIDLWSMGLEEISSDTISRLSQFSCIPVVAKDVAFEQRDPELKIFLALNHLTSLPGALFDLSHLTVLSLRGNQLTELPPSISKLRNLKQLNVSQNRLRYLPAEFNDLLQPAGMLRDLVLHPNPFFQPQHSFGYLRDDGSEGSRGDAPLTEYVYTIPRGDEIIPYMLTQHLGRSPLQITNSNRRAVSDFRLPLKGSIDPLPVELPDTDVDSSLPSSTKHGTSYQWPCRKPSAVPSLVEAALRACYHSSQLLDLESYIPEDLSHLRQLIHHAIEQKETGGLVCSRCRKLVVVPTMQWVEWREIRTCEVALNTPRTGEWTISMKPLSKVDGEMAVPFLHRGCSWHCGPVVPSLEKAWAVPGGFRSKRELGSVELAE